MLLGAFTVLNEATIHKCELNTNDYLFRVSISGVLEEKKAELMGVYESADVPEKEEDND